MFSAQSHYGFASGYQNSYAFDENMLYSYTQGYLGAHPSAMGGWHAPACNLEVSPWAWQWSEGIRTQEVRNVFQSPTTQSTKRVSLWQDPMMHHSYTASISQPHVQPTYAVDQAPPTFSRVVGGPVFRPEIICPRPIRFHPRPKWIDMVEWEDDEDEEGSDLTLCSEGNDVDTDREGEGWSDEEDYDVLHQFLPSFILSPDPEDLPTPSFHPSNGSQASSRSLASLSPDASDLPQPYFDSDRYSPAPVVSSRSSRPDSLESIVAPDPEDLPPPDFETYDRFEVEGFKFPEPHDRHQDRFGERGTRDRVPGADWWRVVMGGEREVSGHRRRPDWTWDG